jgi:hypothetical protein
MAFLDVTLSSSINISQKPAAASFKVECKPCGEVSISDID